MKPLIAPRDSLSVNQIHFGVETVERHPSPAVPWICPLKASTRGKPSSRDAHKAPPAPLCDTEMYLLMPGFCTCVSLAGSPSGRNSQSPAAD